MENIKTDAKPAINAFFNRHAAKIAVGILIPTMAIVMAGCSPTGFVCGPGGCNKAHKAFNQRAQTVNLRTNRAPHQAFNTNSRR